MVIRYLAISPEKLKAATGSVFKKQRECGQPVKVCSLGKSAFQFGSSFESFELTPET